MQKKYWNCPQDALLTLQEIFIRPHLDYADSIYDKPNNELSCKKIDTVQYKACLTITGAIQGTSQEKLYQELGLKSISDRRWYRKLIFFYKIKNKLTLAYLNSYLYTNNNTNQAYSTRSSQNETLRTFSSITESFKHSFFPYCIK